jgi:general secretion pathway protein I
MAAPAERGFTLIEALVAFVIAALVLGSVLPVLGDAVRGSARAEGYTRAVLWAESLLDAVGRLEPLAEGDEAGDFGDGYRWRTAVRAFQPGGAGTANLPALYEVLVAVTWADRGRERTVELATLRLAAP